MSYRRRLFALLAVLGGLVALYLIGVLVLSPGRARLLLPHFRAQLASSITIEGKGVEVLLSREPSDAWWISIEGEQFPADASHVHRLLAALTSAEAVRVASSDPKTWGSFMLEPNEAVRLLVSGAGASAVDLFVGKTTPTGSGDYLRVQGNPSVVVTAAPLSSYLREPVSWWSDLKILPRGLSPASLQEIGIRARDFRVGAQSVTDDYLLVSTVSGGATRWAVEGRSSFRLDPKRLLELEGELLGLTGEGFVPHPDQKATGLDAPVAQVLVGDVQGRRWLIEVGRRAGSSFYVKLQDRPYVYRVNQYTLRRLLRSLPELAR